MKLVAQSVTIFFLVLLISQVSFAEDVAGSSDHPMVSRYGGSSIKDYDYREFDEYEILLGKVVSVPGEPDNSKAESSENLEGKVTKISYYLPEDRSTLEVFRNYEDALKAAGFEILFTCSNKECGGRKFNHKFIEDKHGFGDSKMIETKMKEPSSSVVEFDDYRTFLRDYYLSRKSSQPGWQYCIC